MVGQNEYFCSSSNLFEPFKYEISSQNLLKELPIDCHNNLKHTFNQME